MNHLLAKTKGRNGNFFKVISNEEIFVRKAEQIEPQSAFVTEP